MLATEMSKCRLYYQLLSAILKWAMLTTEMSKCLLLSAIIGYTEMGNACYWNEQVSAIISYNGMGNACYWNEQVLATIGYYRLHVDYKLPTSRLQVFKLWTNRHLHLVGI